MYKNQFDELAITLAQARDLLADLQVQLNNLELEIDGPQYMWEPTWTELGEVMVEDCSTEDQRIYKVRYNKSTPAKKLEQLEHDVKEMFK